MSTVVKIYNLFRARFFLFIVYYLENLDFDQGGLRSP